MADNARNGLIATWHSLLKSGDYSDFTITCGKDTYRVHKAIVCSTSKFIKGAERFEGKKEDKVDLSDDDENVVKLLVQFIYEGEYDPKLPNGKCMESYGDVEVTGHRKSGYGYSYKFPHTCDYPNGASDCQSGGLCQHHHCNYHNKSVACVDYICETCCPDAVRSLPPPPTAGSEQLMLHAKMYEIADKYDVAGLKPLAREKFLRASVKYWDSKRFASAAHYAFSTTPEDDMGLREVVSGIISKHISLLNKPAIEAMCVEYSRLTFGLLKARAKDLGWIAKG